MRWWPGLVLDDRGIVFRFLAAAKYFSLLQIIEVGHEIHPTSYSVGNGGCFSEGKGSLT